MPINAYFFWKTELVFFSDLWNLIVKLPHVFTDTKIYLEF